MFNQNTKIKHAFLEKKIKIGKVTITIKISKLFYIGRNIYSDTQNTRHNMTMTNKKTKKICMIWAKSTNCKNSDQKSSRHCRRLTKISRASA